MGFSLPIRLLEPRCALTAPFHPYLPSPTSGIFSVALIRSARFEHEPPAVSRHAALWRPDFPPGRVASNSTQRLPDRAGSPQYVTPTRLFSLGASNGDNETVQRVFIHNFGCRASQADGAAISASLEDRGFRTTDQNQADLIVINTCTVTAGADVDARRLIRTAHRDNPAAKILVTGCYAQRAPAEIAAIEGVRWVVGNSHKTQIADLVSDGQSTSSYHTEIVAGDISALRDFVATPVRDTRDDRTRPNLKVQDGCSNKCSFCIIPSVRGRSRSAPLAQVIEQIRDLAQRYCEIVLSGINLGRWGRDLPERLRFPDLIEVILAETNVQRLRISSVEPMDWSDRLLELFAREPRIARHVHMPLQSGSDAVLKRMFRKYRTRHYASRVALAHSLLPDAAIGADVMTGFPGETNAEFEETVRFIETQPFTYLHVFTYSERPGTAAAVNTNPIPVEIRRERTRILRRLSDRLHLAHLQTMVGRTLSAVTLEQRGMALTSNFLKVRLSHDRPPNLMIDVRVASAAEGLLHEGNPFPLLA